MSHSGAAAIAVRNLGAERDGEGETRHSVSIPRGGRHREPTENPTADATENRSVLAHRKHLATPAAV
jgi:hypothetical protein